MTFEKIVYHPLLTRVINYLDSSEGRQKVLRLIEYVCRLLAFQSTPANFLLFKRLQLIFAVARKPLRALKSLKHWRSLMVILDDQLSDKKIQIFDAIKEIGYSTYFALDAIYWFRLLNLLSVKGKVELWAYRAWLLGLIGSILGNSRRLSIANARKTQLQQAEDAAGSADQVKETETVIKISKHELIKNALDSVVALDGCVVGISDALVGGAGAITSLMAIRQIWESTSMYK